MSFLWLKIQPTERNNVHFYLQNWHSSINKTAHDCNFNCFYNTLHLCDKNKRHCTNWFEYCVSQYVNTWGKMNGLIVRPSGSFTITLTLQVKQIFLQVDYFIWQFYTSHSLWVNCQKADGHKAIIKAAANMTLLFTKPNKTQS